MPDISMCSGDKCPLKNNCYRYLAEPCEFRQSYFAEPPFVVNSEDIVECDYHWETDLIKKEGNGRGKE